MFKHFRIDPGAIARDRTAALRDSISKPWSRFKLDRSKIGAFATLGAVGVGALMVTAHLVHSRHGADTPPPMIAAGAPSASFHPEPVASPPAAAPVAAPAASVPVVAAAPAPSPVPAPAVSKAAPRIDTTTTGSISPDPAAKLKHKHAKKPKKLDTEG